MQLIGQLCILCKLLFSSFENTDDLSSDEFTVRKMFGLNRFYYVFCSSASKNLKSLGKLVLNSHHSSVMGCLNPNNSACRA